MSSWNKQSPNSKTVTLSSEFGEALRYFRADGGTAGDLPIFQPSILTIDAAFGPAQFDPSPTNLTSRSPDELEHIALAAITELTKRANAGDAQSVLNSISLARRSAKEVQRLAATQPSLCRELAEKLEAFPVVADFNDVAAGSNAETFLAGLNVGGRLPFAPRRAEKIRRDDYVARLVRRLAQAHRLIFAAVKVIKKEAALHGVKPQSLKAKIGGTRQSHKARCYFFAGIGMVVVPAWAETLAGIDPENIKRRDRAELAAAFISAWREGLTSDTAEAAAVDAAFKNLPKLYQRRNRVESGIRALVANALKRLPD